jgi:hypothetical protein
MEFKASRKSGEYMMVAKNDEKKVVIVKNYKGLIDVIEFPIDLKMSEIMGSNYYSLKGLLVTAYDSEVSFKEAVSEYNYYEVECKV